MILNIDSKLADGLKGSNSQLYKNQIVAMNSIIDKWNESKVRPAKKDITDLEKIFWGGIDFTIGAMFGSCRNISDKEFENLLLQLAEQVIDCTVYALKIEKGRMARYGTID